MIALLCGMALAMDRPHVLVAATAGIPDLLGGHVEVFVARDWSVEVGAGVGLLPLSVHAGARWTALFPGGWSGHRLRLAPGVVAYTFPSDPREGMVVLDADVAWVWTGEHVGFTAGVRVGGGVAFGPGSEGVKIEPGMEILPVSVGMVF